MHGFVLIDRKHGFFPGFFPSLSLSRVAMSAVNVVQFLVSELIDNVALSKLCPCDALSHIWGALFAVFGSSADQCNFVGTASDHLWSSDALLVAARPDSRSTLHGGRLPRFCSGFARVFFSLSFFGGLFVYFFGSE